MSRRRKIAWGLVLLLLLGCLISWWVRGQKSDEDQIREAIHQVADGAEAADLARSMEPFSDDYADPDGIGRSGISGILWQQYQKRGPISVWLSPIEVRVEGDRGWAIFEAGLVEGAKGTMVAWPVGAEALHFEVEFRKEDGDWRITSHTREVAIGVSDTG